MSTKRPLAIAFALLVVTSEAAARTCVEGDPYEQVASAYNASDLVFLGKAVDDVAFEGHAPAIIVEKKWKGPEAERITMRLDEWGPRFRRVFFAARSEQPPGWSDRHPSCFPRRSGITIEQVLVELLGEPVAPSQEEISRMQFTFVGILLAAVGGIGVLVWNLRLK